MDLQTLKMKINSFIIKPPHLYKKNDVHFIYLTSFKTLHNISFFTLDILLKKIPNEKI
jgi:hypothetical protein